MPGLQMYYHTEGDGNADSPAVVGFTFAGLAGPDLEHLRQQLPPSVTLERSDYGRFEMKGADPAMSRSDLLQAFYKLMRDNYWMGRHLA